MASSVDTQTIAGFYREARGYLAPLDSCLNQLRTQPAQAEALNELHRLIHLIRGASAVVGIPQITSLGTDLETYLEDLMNGVFDWDDTTIETISEASGLIRHELEQTPAPAVDPSIVEGFLLEAGESLNDISTLLVDLAANPSALLEVRRGIHTIKGAAGMVGFTTLSKLAHRTEDLLDAIASNELTLDPPSQNLLDRATDLLAGLVASGGADATLEASIPSLFDAFDTILAGRVASPVSELATEDAAVSFDTSRYVRVPIQRIDDLVRLVSELFLHRFTFEQSLAKLSHELDELSLSKRRFRQLHASFEEDNLLVQSGASHQPSQPEAEFDPLELDRYTRLFTHSRDLNEATADVAAAEAQLRLLNTDFDAFLSREKRLSSQLQDRLLRFRMVPLSSVSARLHRTVRAAAAQSGHDAELVIEGATTEIDKPMLEQLCGPLEHLLRNAVDHGIEPPSTRQAAGKPTPGRISLSATHEGTQVVIRLSDDGAGLPLESIRHRAITLGLIDANAEPSAEDIERLLFMPGFSTAEDVTEISGRGLGLDVARTTVEALKGTLTVNTLPGEGTTFTIRLPLTLAITRVLLVEAGGQRFAIPIASVSVVARLNASGFKQVQIGNNNFPLHSLAGLLGLPAAPQHPDEKLPIAVLRGADSQFAVHLDRILDAREVVVKPLHPWIGRAPHLIGATVLADGSIAPILDPTGLFAARPNKLPAPAPLASAKKSLNILIVDDSLSVRRVIAALLAHQGWQSGQAKDGVEALEILRRSTSLPDLILLDVEMPRMDGFELTTTLRANPQFATLPIVMLTSRSSDKHRAKAFAAGVSAYLVKPYQDERLLSTILALAGHAARPGDGSISVR